jgi:hypothetical protein
MKQKLSVITFFLIIGAFLFVCTSSAIPPMPSSSVTGLTAANAVAITGGSALNLTTAQATLVKWGQSADIAITANVVNLAAANGTSVNVTGSNTPITGFGNLTTDVGTIFFLRMTGTNVTLTHNATSLITPGSRNYLLNTNDRIAVKNLGSGNWLINELLKSSGVATGTVPITTFTTTGTANLADVYGGLIDINGAANTTVTLPTIVAGMGFDVLCSNADCCIDTTDTWNVSGSNLTTGNKLCSTGGNGSTLKAASKANGVLRLLWSNCNWVDGGS